MKNRNEDSTVLIWTILGLIAIAVICAKSGVVY